MANFLTQQEIEAAIEHFSRTPQGKQAISEAMGSKRAKFVARFSADRVASAAPEELARMRTLADQMADILYAHITQDTGTSGRAGLRNFPRSAIIVGQPTKVGNTGNYSIKVSFDQAALHRDSLDQDAYPEGINDIVQLFVRGYDAKGSVHGEWHGASVVSLRHREPNDFMSSAVAEFNAKNGGNDVVATLNNRYQ